MTVFLLTARALLLRRRSLALLLAVATVPFFVVLNTLRGDLSPDVQAIIVGRLLITTVTPLVALVLAVTAIGGERESGTIVYLATSRLSRMQVAGEKALAAVVCAVVLLLPALVSIVYLGSRLGVGTDNILRAVAGSVLVAPYGGTDRRFSTAPYCVGVPRPGQGPLVLDFATSIVAEGKVVIVDENTGRLMTGRRWSDGLHQAVEAKENVHIQQESVTYATITLQNFFRMYRTLSGMTGTAATEAEELDKIYKLDVLTIPTHRPMVRDDMPDLVYRNTDGKFRAVIEDVKAQHALGRPVLVGTVAIETSEYLSDLLRRQGIDHVVAVEKTEPALARDLDVDDAHAAAPALGCCVGKRAVYPFARAGRGPAPSC